jgi:hypothetical protein
MKTRLASIIGSCFLAVLLQLVAVLTGPFVGLLAAGVVALVPLLLFKFFGVDLAKKWIAIAVPGIASLLAVLLVFASKRQLVEPYVWLAPVMASGGAALVYLVQRSRAKRCALCNRRLGGVVCFSCPRCGLIVCDDCWIFANRRCRLCEQNRVPIFLPDGRWWDHELGPRSKYGRCQLCQTLATEADLRLCRKCGRPQCRDCWDSANGECVRCHWTIENVPDSLKPYILGPQEHEIRASRRH